MWFASQTELGLVWLQPSAGQPQERFSLEKVCGLINHMVVCEWWARNEQVSDCWILIRRMRSKKTVNNGQSRRKPQDQQRESSGLGRGAYCQFLPSTDRWCDLGKATSSLWDSEFFSFQLQISVCKIDFVSPKKGILAHWIKKNSEQTLNLMGQCHDWLVMSVMSIVKETCHSSSRVSFIL